MLNRMGITQKGLKTALKIKEDYRANRPILMPGKKTHILEPETVMNEDIDLFNLEGPLPLAMIATRDPEAPMAVAAATRLSPLGARTKLLSGMVGIISETSKHDTVKECMGYVADRHFDTSAILKVRRQATKFIIQSRQQYTDVLRNNLKALLDGIIAPRQFVKEFFELTDAGNMRNDIRKKLILSLLLSSAVRPSVKFIILENFHLMATAVQSGIISGVLDAAPSRHTEIIKEELRYLVLHRREEQVRH